MGQFEIVQTEPEGEGKQPYYLRLIGGNGSDKIVHSEKYAHRSGAEGAYVAIASTLVAADGPLHVKWNRDRTLGYLMSGGWMVSHSPIHFVSEVEPAPAKVAKKPTRKTTAKKATPAKKTTRKTPHTHAHDPVLEPE